MMATNQTVSHRARMGTLIPAYPGPGPPTGTLGLGGPLLKKDATIKVVLKPNGDFSFSSVTNLTLAQKLHKLTTPCARWCLCCQFIANKGTVESACMRRSYYPMVSSGSQLTCETSRVVYVITCKGCCLCWPN